MKYFHIHPSIVFDLLWLMLLHLKLSGDIDWRIGLVMWPIFFGSVFRYYHAKWIGKHKKQNDFNNTGRPW